MRPEPPSPSGPSDRPEPTATGPEVPAGSPRPSRAGRVWLVLWLAFAAFLVVRTGVRDRGVIIDHIEFGRRLVAGEPLYAPYLDAPRPLHPVYPPSFGLLTAPYAALGERGARWAWGLTQVLALTVVGAVSLGVLRRHRPSLGPAARGLVLFGTLFLTSRYVLRDTHGGGGNLINLALALGAWHLACVRNHPWSAGLVLGISLATKPTTVLFVPMLAAFGRWRAAAAGVASAAVWAVLSVVVHGRGLAAWTEWLQGSLAYGAQTDLYAAPAQGFPPFTWMNQSLRPALQRYLGSVPDRYAAEVGPGWFDGAGLDAGLVLWLYRALVVTGLTGALVWCRRNRDDAAGRTVGFALFAALSLLFSPLSWKAHHVALIPAALLVALPAVAGPSRVAAGVLAAVYTLACLLGEELVGKDAKDLQQSLYLTTLGTLAMTAWILVRGRAVLAADPTDQPTAARRESSRAPA